MVSLRIEIIKMYSILYCHVDHYNIIWIVMYKKLIDWKKLFRLVKTFLCDVHFQLPLSYKNKQNIRTTLHTYT